ncbi:hypothetical protein [Microbulbifer sp. JMSA003]|uniref:hypothetical protein n=1 Tax=Microbulbifer sp. JMSA003 TaxID=3243369 RepID=UPI004039417A
MSLFVLGCAALFVVVSFADKEYGVAAFFLAFTVFFGVYSIDRIKLSYMFYPLVVAERHLITHLMMGSRKVYDIDKISKLWIVKDRVIWIHSGWPSVTYVRGLSEDQKIELRELLVGKC